jgi:hypothetical protein
MLVEYELHAVLITAIRRALSDGRLPGGAPALPRGVRELRLEPPAAGDDVFPLELGDWLEALTGWGADAIQLVRPRFAAGTASEHMLASFTGAAPWVLRLRRRPRDRHLVASWNPAPEPGWQVLVRWVPPALEEAVSGVVALGGPDLARLSGRMEAVLRRAARFAGNLPEAAGWGRAFNREAERLGGAAAGAAALAGAARATLEAFEGAGGWNDLQPPPKAWSVYRELSNELYEALSDALIAVLNAGGEVG